MPQKHDLWPWGIQPLDGEAPFDIWLVDTSVLIPDDSFTWLSQEELARSNRFAFDHLRRRYCVSHIALRLILERYTNLAPQSQIFTQQDEGKPILANFPTCHFNLSYADTQSIIGVSMTHEIGVDIENLRHIPDALELSQYHFHPDEHEEFSKLSNTIERDHIFLQGWARKEAYLKALGHGLTIPCSSFKSEFTGTKGVELHGHPKVEIGSIPMTNGHIAAWSRAL